MTERSKNLEHTARQVTPGPGPQVLTCSVGPPPPRGVQCQWDPRELWNVLSPSWVTRPLSREGYSLGLALWGHLGSFNGHYSVGFLFGPGPTHTALTGPLWPQAHRSSLLPPKWWAKGSQPHLQLAFLSWSQAALAAPPASWLSSACQACSTRAGFTRCLRLEPRQVLYQLGHILSPTAARPQA